MSQRNSLGNTHYEANMFSTKLPHLAKLAAGHARRSTSTSTLTRYLARVEVAAHPHVGVARRYSNRPRNFTTTSNNDVEVLDVYTGAQMHLLYPEAATMIKVVDDDNMGEHFQFKMGHNKVVDFDPTTACDATAYTIFLQSDARMLNEHYRETSKRRLLQLSVPATAIVVMTPDRFLVSEVVVKAVTDLDSSDDEDGDFFPVNT